MEQILKQKLQNELVKIVEELKAKHIELGQKATGEWIDSLEIEINGRKGTLYGADYTPALTKGRSPGALPPINPLQQWAEIKLGVSPSESRGVAFAIAKKIQREGTEIHKKGGTDLIEAILTDERFDRFVDNIGFDNEVITAIEEYVLR